MCSSPALVGQNRDRREKGVCRQWEAGRQLSSRGGFLFDSTVTIAQLCSTKGVITINNSEVRFFRRSYKGPKSNEHRVRFTHVCKTLLIAFPT